MNGGPRRPSELRRAWVRGVLIGAAGIAIGGFLAGGFVAGRYEGELGRLRRELAREREARERQQAPHADGDRLADLLRDPATRILVLRGEGAARAAHGQLLWHERTGGELVVGGLPPAPAGRTYVLWAIANGAPALTAVFQVDPSGAARQRVEPMGRGLDRVVVTVEPPGARGAPSGPVVMSGSP